MNTRPSLLSVSNLKSGYFTRHGTISAVDGVSFDLCHGHTVGIVGESGSGKSTLALSLLGLLERPGRVVEGKSSFAGKNLRTLNEKEWSAVRGRQIGMIFQSPESSFNPLATLGQQMCEALMTHQGLSQASALEKAERALAMVGMPRPREILKSYAFELSGGMCQRAALGLALSLNPALLLADEPTASLDVLAQEEMIGLFKEMQKRLNLSMIIISHDLGLIGKLAERTLVMYAGKIVEAGPTWQVLGTPRHPYTRGLLACQPRLDLEPQPIPAMTGAPPSLDKQITGCRFAPRCRWAGSRCMSDDAFQLRPVLANHHVACVKSKGRDDVF